MLRALLRPRRVVHAHCDLPCLTTTPAQARVEAESVKAIQTRYQDAEKFKSAAESVEDYRIRALAIKEARADLVKDHLRVLWTDYFKPEHVEKYPQLHELFWNATKEAGLAKKAVDLGRARSCSTRSTKESARSSGRPRRKHGFPNRRRAGPSAPPFIASGRVLERGRLLD